MNFQEKVKFRLAAYKKSRFPKIKDGTYNYKGKKKTYPHILPKKYEDLNILEFYRDSFFKYKNGEDIKLHKDFKHLNSSQAMCINFFYPLITKNKLNLITDILELPNEEIDSYEFEKDSPIDGVDGHGPTNFDFFISTKSGKSIYFEIKYTESEFGKAKNDKEHIKKHKKIYEAYTDKVAGATYTTKEEFFENYQILRNLIHIDKNSYVVFTYPFGNRKIREGAEATHQKIVHGKKYANHFKPLKWDELLDDISPNLHSRKLLKHYREFD